MLTLAGSWLPEEFAGVYLGTFSGTNDSGQFNMGTSSHSSAAQQIIAAYGYRTVDDVLAEWRIHNIATASTEVARITHRRQGADDAGRIILQTRNAGGSLQDSIDIRDDGGIFFARLLAASSSTDVNINGSSELHSVTSSREFKVNERALELDTSRLYQIAVKSFEWGPDTGEPNMTDFGPIAEEVYTVMPELVNLRSAYRLRRKEGGSGEYEQVPVGPPKPYSLRTQPTIWAMLTEIQNLNQRIRALEFV